MKSARNSLRVRLRGFVHQNRIKRPPSLLPPAGENAPNSLKTTGNFIAFKLSQGRLQRPTLLLSHVRIAYVARF
ncbi:hypothetical protein RB5505 [Rhodopirellula baltica SH 1]|uniref:Uncharacterized protein n=1 Tax=Rhodopirellula baltica (strain DSM 10527 / NCIMB 13988 / SH1) TaxID=243090 RepID=Q7URQ9_RHOBA|nr:hypothetical protein RB5505 [Rhodopirellula baltica SH 1]